MAEQIEIRRDEVRGRVSVVLSVPGTPAEVEGEGDSLYEALFDLAEQVQNEVER